jgi:hypothetical protein
VNWAKGYISPERFLTKHRNRIHAYVVGFSHLVIIVGWDKKGSEKP